MYVSLADEERFPSGGEHGNVLWHAVVAPNLHDVAHQFRLVIQAAPGNSAGIVGIVLEGEKRQIVEPVVLLQIIQRKRAVQETLPVPLIG